MLEKALSRSAGARGDSDNEDPFTGLSANVTSQAPIFGVEGHITRTFSSSIWAALDGYYEIGGETSWDGVAQGDGKETRRSAQRSAWCSAPPSRCD